ncbi:MAG: adenylate/guanylate cyclase domain-containing protein, partial [Candidatus Binatia bacterium]
MVETSGYVVLAIVALGMGVAFLATDPKSPTSRALALLFLELAVIVFLNVPIYADPALLDRYPHAWARLFGSLEAIAFATGYEWLVRIRRTELGREGPGSHGEALFRIAQALAAFHGALGLLQPEWRLGVWEELDRGHGILEIFGRPEVLVATVPIYASIIPAAASIIDLARSKPDSAEVVRLNAIGIAAPFLFSGMFVPGRWMPITMAIGLSIFLVGAVRYHVVQGERAQFLSRFLSPQVATLVRERGLLRALEKTRLEICVVACDLRGFTAYTESVPSEEAVGLLEEYYEQVGAAAAAYGGTIKDHAGDGILVLVGAPIPVPDPPARAVKMAEEIRERASKVLARRASNLGVGIGVATGPATVGAIAAATRLEY